MIRDPRPHPSHVWEAAVPVSRALDPSAGPAERLRRIADDVVGLMLPVECAGCGAWDVAVCPRCADLLAGSLTRCEGDAGVLVGTGAGSSGGAGALPVWTAAAYAGPVRGMVLAWKGPGGAALARPVAAAARSAGRALGAELRAAGLLAQVDAVVPVPSGWRRRARGRLVVRDLARAVATGLSEDAGAPVRSLDVLRRGGGRSHQSGLGSAARSANRRRTVRLARGLPPGTRCVLVDDVVTTGATLAECARALRDQGHPVLGAFVLAATPRPGGGPA